MQSLYLWSLKRAFGVMIPLFFLNWIGVQYSLYGVLWWWDVMTHFMGGVFIGFLLLSLGGHLGLAIKPNWIRYWIIASLVIFVGWELYEIVVNLIIPTYKMNYIDTIHDIVNDCLGGGIAYCWYSQFSPHYKSNLTSNN